MLSVKYSWLIGLFILIPFTGKSQSSLKITQPVTAGPDVFDENGNRLSMPFAGGLNACQLGAVDLNADGVEDLVVFDRQGYRLLTFINEGLAGEISYVYQPVYEKYFPPVEHWMQLVDYNNDGKEDIFTYTTGGIKVYRNDSQDVPVFTQVSKPYLVSLQGTTLTNIFVTYVDYPAIVDVDNDGDKDILTFWGLGSFVEWHKNLSMENFGTADSLIFEKVSDCWGRFAEGAENNSIQLDTCVSFDEKMQAYSGLKGDDPKHTGSTLLVHDFNGDGLPDLALGDVDYPALIRFTNGGTSEEAKMVSFTDSFPGDVNPVHITSFPACSAVDVNNDGRTDLIASPFEPSLIRCDGFNSNWLYLDEGTGTIPGYNFIQKDFLQKDMIDLGSGAFPALFDYNGDGLQDLIVGNYGYVDSSWLDPVYGLKCEYVSSLALFENTGTADLPAFKLVTRDYLNLSSLQMQSLIPAVGDVDGDHKTDILCGNSKGKFVFLKNKASSGQPADFEPADPAFQQIDVGDFSAPQVADLDGDGLNDLVSGNKKGKLSYYRNTGQAGSPSYTLVTDSLGGIDVTNTAVSYYGYSIPLFYNLNDGQKMLLVGSEFGEIFVYSGIENNLDGHFTFEGLLQGLEKGWRSSPALGNIDGDTLTELFVGNYSGGLTWYKGYHASPDGVGEERPAGKIRLEIIPNPASDKATIMIEGLKEDPSGIRICLYDMSGARKYASERCGGRTEIPLKGFAPGLYPVVVTLEIKGAVTQATGKIMVVR